MSNDASPAPRRWPLAPVLIFLVALVPVAVTPVIPAVDFYNHLARYYVLANLDSDASLAANYVAVWKLLPNLGMDVVGVALMQVLPPLVVGHVIVLLIFATQYVGVLTLHAALTRRVSTLTAILSAGLLYSYILVWGFSNFLWGMGLALLVLAWWVRTRHRPLIGVPVAMLLAALIYFVHAFAFGLYGVILGGLALGFWWQEGRRVIDLARSMGLLALQAAVPAMLFLFSPTVGAEGGVTNVHVALKHYAETGYLAERLWFEFHHRLALIVRTAEGPAYLFDAITFAVTVAGLGYLLWRRQLQVAAAAWPAIVLLGILCVVVPPAMFGVGWVSDRVPLALALLVAASLSPQFASAAQARAVVLAFGALFLIRLAATTLEWAQYRNQYADFEKATAPIPPGAMVTGLIVFGADTRDGLLPRCQMYPPLTVIERRAIAPLFVYGSAQPMELRGKLLQATSSRLPRPDFKLRPVGTYYEDALAKVARERNYDYVLMCGAERLTRPAPANLQVAGAAGQFRVYKVN